MYTITTSPIHCRSARPSGRGWIAIAVWLSAAAVSPDLSAQVPARSATPFRLTFLVNEGFLLEAGGKSVLIDAFVRDEYYGYGALPESTYQQLIRGEPPFADVSLALTSHGHLDHFQAEPAALFLLKHPRALFVSAEEVVLAIRNVPQEPPVGNQTQVLWPDVDAFQSLEHDGIRVTGFRLRHTNPRNANVQNLGLLIQVGDTTVLHVGDAEATVENLDPFDLPQQHVDVAILPVWMFRDRPLIDEHVGARAYVAAHIPVVQLAQTKREFAKSHPGVVVLEKPLESWTLNGGRDKD